VARSGLPKPARMVVVTSGSLAMSSMPSTWSMSRMPPSSMVLWSRPSAAPMPATAKSGNSDEILLSTPGVPSGAV
jgi:hypothetical protein